MFGYLETARDLLILRSGDAFVTFACDTLGAIGEKEQDLLHVSPVVGGQYAARVCLNETVAIGAVPLAVLSLVCNEWTPTGQRVLEGIRVELAAGGWEHVPVHGSTEENFPTPMTAFGLCVVAETARLHWRQTHPGDRLCLLGRPYVGEEVLAHEDALLTPQHIPRLFARHEIGDFLPCGSRGIQHEISVLERETGLRVTLNDTLDQLLLAKSAGPATCGIFTSGDDISDLGLLCEIIGHLHE